MFRIHIYLSLYNFLKAFFLPTSIKLQKEKIKRIVLGQSKKKEFIFSSQCRIAFLYILKFLKNEDRRKNEIIFCSYNLPEMINVAKNLNYKIKFCDLNYKDGFLQVSDLKKLISKKTKAIVLTNMFNNFEQSMRVKKIVKKKNIFIIEDNAIYFDNYTKLGKKIKYSGSIGDFSIYSFNIMKNISGMYGGALTTNNLKFINFYNSENNKNDIFFKTKFIGQIVTYLILKIMSINLLYKHFFIKIIKNAHLKKWRILLNMFYPSLKFKIIKFPNYYFTKISDLAVSFIYLQMIDLHQRKKVFVNRKKKNCYYHNQLSKIRNKNFNLIKITDFNYQNFLDFPILVKNKEKLNIFLLKNGIETKFIHYKNCEKIFNRSKRSKSCKNSSLFEKELICLPSHEKITFNYIDKVIRYIKIFLDENKKS